MTALILLASGRSERFAAGNKLLANLRGRPLVSYAAALWQTRSDVERIAVIPSGAEEIAGLLKATNWTLVHNPAPEKGQANSLKLGLAKAIDRGTSRIIICLADMPFVTDQHLDDLLSALDGKTAVMCICGGTLMPPAAFAISAFSELSMIEGDAGARSVFSGLSNTATLSLSARQAQDVDTLETLVRLNAEVDA